MGYKQKNHTVNLETDVSISNDCKQVRLQPTILSAAIWYCEVCASGFFPRQYKHEEGAVMHFHHDHPLLFKE